MQSFREYLLQYKRIFALFEVISPIFTLLSFFILNFLLIFPCINNHHFYFLYGCNLPEDGEIQIGFIYLRYRVRKILGIKYKRITFYHLLAGTVAMHPLLHKAFHLSSLSLVFGNRGFPSIYCNLLSSPRSCG